MNTVFRAKRTRSKIHGTAERPRLSVKISNRNIIAQLIDDEGMKTLAYATTVNNKAISGTMTEKAALIGKEIAEKAKKAKIKSVVFDRGAKLYASRLSALADAARKEGLEF